MKVIEGIKLDFNDVVIRPKRSNTPSRRYVKLDRKFQFFHSDKHWEGLPIIAANMDTTGSLAMGKALGQNLAVTCLHKHYNLEELKKGFKHVDRHYTWVSTGVTDDNLDHLKEVIRHIPNVNICIDVANGYTEWFVDRVKRVREMAQNAIIMAGNVCTPDMTMELILGGADIVKIGIGPGSVCTTRKVTGVGYPQLSAIMECADAAHGLKSADKRLGLVCADGGCTTSGDIAKAFGANADFVMLGGMLAGTDECEGEWELSEISSEDEDECYQRKLDLYKEFVNSIDRIIADRTLDIRWAIDKYILQNPNCSAEDVAKKFFPSKYEDYIEEINTIDKEFETEKTYLKFYGMSSYEAQDKYSENRKSYIAEEGKVVKIPAKGPVKDVISEICGGLKSACSYIGATCLKDMSKCTTFIRVNRTHNTVYGF